MIKRLHGMPFNFTAAGCNGRVVFKDSLSL